MASLICAQASVHESENPKNRHVYVALAVQVTSALASTTPCNISESPVSTVCMGMASAGSLILQAGEAGQRISLPNAKIMVRKPSGGARGMASDIEIQAEDIKKTKRLLNELYVKHTGQPYE